MKTRRSPPRDVLADARRVIAANDRELALQLLLKICSGGERTASQLPEAIAEALVATARRQQDDNGRTVLQAHTDGSIAREEIVSLIGGAFSRRMTSRPSVLRWTSGSDGISLLAKQQRPESSRQHARPLPRNWWGREGAALAVKLGRGHVEIKYILTGRPGG